MPSVWYQSIYRKEPALGARDLQAKPEEHGTVLISCVILSYLCLEADLFCLATIQHVIQAGTFRLHKLALCLPADCTASTGRQQQHDTRLVGGDK